MRGQLLQYVASDQADVVMGEVGDDFLGSETIPSDDTERWVREEGAGVGGEENLLNPTSSASHSTRVGGNHAPAKACSHGLVSNCWSLVVHMASCHPLTR